MNIRSQIATLAICTWVGMVAFPMLGLLINAFEMPEVLMECPNHVWSMIENGGLTRDMVTQSDETMQQYSCEYVFTERESFSQTNWPLFGIVTGFMIGTAFLRKPSPMIVKVAHHGESE